MFHSKLGSMQDKVRRVEKLCEWLAPDDKKLQDAARLCKNDLVTEIVNEFPELQGIIGGYYASSDAIRNHYKPLGQDDSVPTGDAALLALADKVDSLVSLMVAGEKATGSGDPYALRRYALGIIRILIENDLRVDLRRIVDIALQDLAYITNHKNLLAREVLGFIEDRLKHYLRGRGDDIKIIHASVDLSKFSDIAREVSDMKVLDLFLKTVEGDDLLAAYKRVNGIISSAKKNIDQNHSMFFKTTSLKLPEEEELFYCILPLLEQERNGGYRAIKTKEDFAGTIKRLSSLLTPINNFFDKVLVNDADKDVARNRVFLLQLLLNVFDNVAKFGELL